MADCHYCGGETTLYDEGVAVCIHCSDDLDAGRRTSVLALKVMLGMGRYIGPFDEFLKESTSLVGAQLGSPGEDARAIMQSLLDTGRINFRIDPGSEPTSDDNSGFSWFIPEPKADAASASGRSTSPLRAASITK